MGYELIITEKPNASKRIAQALADGKSVKKEINKVPYYLVTHKDRDIVVACAVGHLYGISEKEKSKGFAYPVFEVEWVPTSEMNKKAAFSKKYLQALKKLAKDADSFTVATDYDVEGEVIGLNCVRFACGKKDANRMKFSTLTKEDIVEAYESKHKTLDWGQANAGEARHFLDWYYGINLSRALTTAIKTAGVFKILSIGRVQGPALKIVVDREKEIKSFKPVPFWQITALMKNGIEALHEEDKFWEEAKASKTYEKVRGEKYATVDSVERKRMKQLPPAPFDLTTLQTESHRCFGISPKNTLGFAQDLYTSGYISYPRTSSQQLDSKIGFRNILKKLSVQENYAKLCGALLKTGLKPHNGKKSDPAHPAIYPTGEKPKGLEGPKAKIYDLIVRRFMATFGESASRETNTIIFLIADERFITKGTRTVEQGWHIYYGKYVSVKDEEVPAVNENESIQIRKIEKHSRETQPPKRYTESSLIRALEKKNIGTKSTRAQIIDTLQQRNYITGKPLEATDLGIHIEEVLQKHVPKIVDEKLTRSFEERMEKIREKKESKEKILDDAKKVLTKILSEFKKEESGIGKELMDTFRETRTQMNTIGKCPNCDEGNLVIKRGKFGMFIACNGYPECKTTLSLPKGAMIKATDNLCDACKFPIAQFIRKGNRPQMSCINTDCPKKEVAGVAEKPCPKCGKGTMKLKKSIYGQFLACDQYPKCRSTEPIGEPKANSA